MSRRDWSVTRRDRRCRFEQIDVYPVTCESLSSGRTDEDILHAVIAGGARIIQLRDKVATRGRLRAKAEYFRDVTRRHGVLLIVNDDVEVALGVDADGVHIGQGDCPLEQVREQFPDGLIGVSTHTRNQAIEAQNNGADYVNIGPIYSTKTKDGLHEFLGPQAISQIAPSIDIPFTVMGGIHDANLADVLAAGARRIAMVTAITQAPDVAAAVSHFRSRIRAASAPVRL